MAKATAANNAPLKGKRVAILATDGFEQSELLEPRLALDAAGAATVVIAPKAGSIAGWRHGAWGQTVAVDLTLDKAQADDYDALMLPGGVMNPDRLRTDKSAVAFVRAFFDSEKPVAAICHAPIMLIEPGGRNRELQTVDPGGRGARVGDRLSRFNRRQRGSAADRP